MSVRSQLVNVQGSNLRDLRVFASKHGGFVMIRNVGGLILENTGDEDSYEERIVPGVLVEEVSKYGGYADDESIKMTVWAGGSMHEIVTDPEAEVEARLCQQSDDTAPIPELELCGRCNRHLVPLAAGGDANHVGC